MESTGEIITLLKQRGGKKIRDQWAQVAWEMGERELEKELRDKK